MDDEFSDSERKGRKRTTSVILFIFSISLSIICNPFGFLFRAMRTVALMTKVFETK